jgi:cob(I)alamin adenosyltransferase
MVTLNKLYTRQGDSGMTSLLGTEKVRKSSARVQVIGELDELNCWCGAARTLFPPDCPETHIQRLAWVQNTLFDFGAILAAVGALPKEYAIPTATTKDVELLEQYIDEYVAEVPPLTSFVLPGGTSLNATLHLARAVCRRAERSLVILMDQENLPTALYQYVNRLSDFLFALARFASQLSGDKEFKWVPTIS